MTFPKKVTLKEVGVEKEYYGFALTEPEPGRPFCMLFIEGDRTFTFKTSVVSKVVLDGYDKARIETENSEYEIADA